MQGDLSKSIVSSFAEIAKEKEIDRTLLLSILEDVFRSIIKKDYGTDEPFEVIFNADRGDIQILHIREVVPDDELEDEVSEITLSEARKLDKNLDLYDEYPQEIPVEKFGRRAVQMAKQIMAQRLREIEKDNIYEDYTDRIGDIILGDVYQVRSKDILVNHNGIELVLPKRQQIYKDRYRKGDTIRAVVLEVTRDNGNPTVIISRTAPEFLERLFENEIPEVFDGIIEIVKAVREPGERAKVAVISHDERVDPVGACVGMKGQRIHAIVRELCNENIDVIPYTKDKIEFIKRALQPATVLSVDLDKDGKRAKVVVPIDQVSKAIGKNGVNIRLASMLTECEIDVFREVENEDDIDIQEFTDEFGEELVQLLYDIGCDSARSVMELKPDELVRRTNGRIDRETAAKVIETVTAEFDEE
jgi:N utilization substance protein A